MCVCIIFYTHIYGMLVEFGSLRTLCALMCKIHIQDKVPVLIHVLCNLMNMSDFCTKIFITAIILKNQENIYS